MLLAQPSEPRRTIPLNKGPAVEHFCLLRNERLVALFGLALLVAGCARTPEAKQKLQEERFLKGRVFAEVKILASPMRLILQKSTERDLDFDVFRETQGRLMTGPFILQTALRQPGIAMLSQLKDQPNPIKWLEKHLVVDFPAREFMRISMKSDQREDAAAIVNAVVNAYLEEVADAEVSQRKRRRMELEKALEGLVARQKIKASRLLRLTQEAGAASETALTVAELAMVEFYELARHELALEEFGRAKEEIELEILESGAAETDASSTAGTESPASADLERLRESIKERSNRINGWKRLLETAGPNRRATVVHSLDLNALRRELDETEAFMKTIREELRQIEIEGGADSPRVLLFRQAMAEEGP